MGDKGGKIDLLLNPADMTWATAWKKKKLVNSDIFTSITALAAMMSRRAMIFKTRIALRITYPGPAKDSFKKESIVVKTGALRPLKIEAYYKRLLGNSTRDDA